MMERTWKGYSLQKGPNYVPKRVKAATDLTRYHPQRWHPPPRGALRLNFDGSAIGNPSMAGVGGVICNDGIIILSYSGPASVCSINKAELLALLIGLREASHLQPQLLLVEGDSSCVIQWATWSSSPLWYLADII